MKRILKKGLSLAMTMVLALTLLFNVGVLEPKAAGVSVRVADAEMNATGDSGVLYYKNGDSSTLTGTASDYNAKLEWNANGTTLTFNNLVAEAFAGNVVEASGSGDITIVLQGTNTIMPGESWDPNFDYYGFTGLAMENNNVTIKGSGKLIVTTDMRTWAYGFIEANDLYITDSAEVVVAIGYLHDGIIHGVRTNGNFKMDGTASLDINLGNTTCLATDIYALYVRGENAEISGNSSLDIKTAATTYTQYGFMSNNTKISTSGEVSIDLATSNSINGLSANNLEITNSQVKIKLADAGANGNVMGAGASNMTLNGTSVLDIDLAGGAWPIGLAMNTGTLTLNDSSTIDINTRRIGNYGTGITMNKIEMFDTSSINVTSSDAGQSTYGIIGNSNSELIMHDSSIIDVKLGDGTVESKGIGSRTLAMDGDSKIIVESGNASSLSVGLYTNQTSKIEDNATITAMSGNASSTSDGKSIAISTLMTISDNAGVYATSGVGGKESIGIQNPFTPPWEVDGGTIESTSPGMAFSFAPKAGTGKALDVKAGANSTSATAKTIVQAAEETTYTGNKYVMIKTKNLIETVQLSGIDDLKHDTSPDTSATTTTTGVNASIPVSWVPTGNAVGGTDYTATITITPEDGYMFAADAKVYVDGTEVTATLQNDGTLKATYNQTATMLNLVSVAGPSGEMVVDNGTAIENMRLPGTVAITTDDGNRDQVDVRWNLSNVNYNPSSKEEQVFTITGTAVLPAYVEPGNVSLNVTLTVRVKAANTESSTETSTEASTEATTAAPTTQTPGTGSMTDTEAPTTATATTEAPVNSDANVKTGDNAPLNIMIVLMLLAGMGMVIVSKKRKTTF